MTAEYAGVEKPEASEIMDPHISVEAPVRCGECGEVLVGSGCGPLSVLVDVVA